MTIVAVCGGSGDVGRTIVQAIAAAGRHKVVVLSRTAAAGTGEGDPDRVAVDYNDVENLSSVLRKHGVSVVIAALLLADDAIVQSQVNLIRAAAKSGTVKKFIPTEFHLDYNRRIEGVDIHFAEQHCRCEQEIKRHPELTYTLIRIGLFMDYLALPHHPKPTNLRPIFLFVDLDHQVVVVPGNGNNIVVLNHSSDVAAYIERLIDLPAEHWPRESVVHSNRIQAKDLVDIVKKISGQEFKVSWAMPDAIRDGKGSLLPSNQGIFADPAEGALFQALEKEVMLTVLGNGYDLPGRDLAELFPDVQTTDLEGFLREAWRLKEAADAR